MKKIFFLLLTVAVVCFGVMAFKKNTAPADKYSAPIATIITDGPFLWKASAVPADSYQKIQPAGDGQPVMEQVQFKKDGSFQFVFLKLGNDGVKTETVVKGQAIFTKSDKGKNIVVTSATTGCSKETSNGVTSVHPIAVAELHALYSANWLWEKIPFPGIPSEDFLLLVNITAHPEAYNSKPGSINMSWVSKFYCRK